MIIDAKWVFCETATTTEYLTLTTTATIYSTAIDTRKVNSTTLDNTGEGYADGGGELYLYIRCKTLGQASIETFILQDSLDDSSFATIQSFTVSSAANLQDKIVVRAVLPPGLRRYFRIGGTNTTSGTNVYEAWIATS